MKGDCSIKVAFKAWGSMLGRTLGKAITTLSGFTTVDVVDVEEVTVDEVVVDEVTVDEDVVDVAGC